MPGPEHVDAAATLLRRAAADLRAAQALADDADQDDAVVGFHAQQAVEKALKAVLAIHEVEVPRTHDIRFLLLELDRNGVAVAAVLVEARYLTPWAVAMRYDDGDDDSLDRKSAVTTAEAALAWARRAVETSP